MNTLATLPDLQVFTYSQLTPSAKERAFKQWQISQQDSLFYEDGSTYIIEAWQETLAERGITDVDIQFTGFGSQGDGASFTGDINLRKLMEWDHSTDPNNNMVLTYPAIYTSQINFNEDQWINIDLKLVRTGSYYSHENTVDIESQLTTSSEGLKEEFNKQWYDGEYSSLHSSLEIHILQLCREWMKALYKDLEAEHDYYFSEELFLDECGSYGYKFTESGKLIHTD